MKEDIGMLIEQETQKRLEEMQKPTYKFPKSIGKADWIVIAALIIGCIGLIVYEMIV